MIQSAIINGYKIHAFSSKASLLSYIKEEKKILVAMNAEKISKKNNRLREIVNRNIGYSDGVGAVMALRQNELKSMKIAGSEFWLDIVQHYHHERRFYLIGSTSNVIHHTVERLKREFPQIQIVGYRDGFLKREDKIALIQDLKRTKPDIVFVAQGSPRQEFLMNELLHAHPALYMGLGGSFDIYAGVKQRAPRLFLNYHLEWFYRLLKEPTRIGRQITLIKFLLFHIFFINIIE